MVGGTEVGNGDSGNDNDKSDHVDWVLILVVVMMMKGQWLHLDNKNRLQYTLSNDLFQRLIWGFKATHYDLWEVIHKLAVTDIFVIY